jgi:hypothetical protein
MGAEGNDTGAAPRDRVLAETGGLPAMTIRNAAPGMPA